MVVFPRGGVFVFPFGSKYPYLYLNSTLARKTEKTFRGRISSGTDFFLDNAEKKARDINFGVKIREQQFGVRSLAGIV